jgi:hypothetical protein
MEKWCAPLQSNLQQYVENKYVTESTGFKALPEIINGRAAMIGEKTPACTVSNQSPTAISLTAQAQQQSLSYSAVYMPSWPIHAMADDICCFCCNHHCPPAGFVAGASAEILGAGPLLLQLSKYPQPVLVVMALITAGSIIPVVKGSEGGYLQSLRETYTIPEGVFTEPLVRRCSAAAWAHVLV